VSSTIARWLKDSTQRDVRKRLRKAINRIAIFRIAIYVKPLPANWTFEILPPRLYHLAERVPVCGRDSITLVPEASLQNCECRHFARMVGTGRGGHREPL
jgi:hypothetical protein